MQIKTISTAAGVNEIDFGNDDSQATAHFYWFKNLSDSTLYVSAMPDPVAGADNVAELSAKGAASVETDESKVYVLGAGKVEIHRTNSKFCPFELPSTGSGGGGTIDAYSKTESDAKYAQKTDIPSSLPANGGNADTVDGLHANDFAQIIDFGGTVTDTKTAVGQPGKTTIYRCFNWTDVPIGLIDSQGSIITIDYKGTGTAGIHPIWCMQIFISAHGSIFTRAVVNTTVNSWQEISTTPIKKMTFTGVATNAGGRGSLFSADFGTPITIACTSRRDTQCTPFFYRDDNVWLLLAKDCVTLDPIPAGSYSFDVWYI